MESLSTLWLYLGLLVVAAALATLRFRESGTFVHLARHYGNLFVLLVVPIVGSVVVLVSAENRNAEVADIKENTQNLISKLRSSYVANGEVPFAYMQAKKLSVIIRNDSQIKKNRFKIDRYERLCVVEPEYVCSVEVMDFWTGNDTLFDIHHVFGRDVLQTQDKFRALLREIDEAGEPLGPKWDTVYGLTNASNSNRNGDFTIKVPVERHMRIRLDMYKKGWSKYSPISFVGIDTREYLSPPTHFGFWLLFNGVPWTVDRWALNIEEIRGIGTDDSLIQALIDKDDRIYAGSLSRTAEIPDNSLFGFGNDFFEWVSRNSVRYRTVFRHTTNDLYGLSFWQHDASIIEQGPLVDNDGNGLMVHSELFR